MENHMIKVGAFRFVALFLMVASQGSCADDAREVRVATFNIRREGKEKEQRFTWDKRKPLVIDALQQLDADVIGLQEATTGQINDLSQALEGYGHVSQGRGSSWAGLGTDEHVPLFFNTKTVSCLSSGTFYINERRSLNIKSNGWLPRICTWGRFEHKVTGRQFCVYNVHLDNHYEKARVNSAHKIMKMIEKQHRNCPIVVCGDFNAPFNGVLQKSFTGFYEPSLNGVVSPVTRTGFDGKKKLWIDHIVVQESASVATYAIVSNNKDGLVISDHCPVYADISWRNGGTKSVKLD